MGVCCRRPGGLLCTATHFAQPKRSSTPAPFPLPGNRHPLSLPELQQRYAHVPPAGLQLALGSLLRLRQQGPPQPAAAGLTSLLEAGMLGTLLPQQGAQQAQQGVGSKAPQPKSWPPPRWVPPFHQSGRPALPQRLLLRELGTSAAVRQRRGLLPPSELAGAGGRGLV